MRNKVFGGRPSLQLVPLSQKSKDGKALTREPEENIYFGRWLLGQCVEPG